jgi:hypothetical protein
VTFTNSRFGPPYYAYLDNVPITAIPELKSIALAAVGALALPLFLRKVRRGRDRTVIENTAEARST